MARYILKFSSILLISFVLIESSFGQQCDAGGMRKMDSFAAKLITLGSSGRKFPENKGSELKKFCDDSSTYVNEIENHKNKCLRDLPKQVTGVMLYSLKNLMSQLCKKDSKRLTDLIASTPCINKANAEMNRCYSNLIDALIGTQHAEDKNKIPHLCCEYFKMLSCMSTRPRRIKSCTDFQIEKAVDFTRSIVGNAVDLICGDYTEGSDKCETLGPAPKKKKNQRRTKSFVVPLINLLSTFPEA